MSSKNQPIPPPMITPDNNSVAILKPIEAAVPYSVCGFTPRAFCSLVWSFDIFSSSLAMSFGF